MKVYSDGKIPIKSWCENPEDGALDQARNLTKLPFAFKQVCLMPDTHQGYGMPIGGVMATKGVIVPNAVGVDIGCGMGAVKTSLREIDIDTIKKIMGDIRETIPVGFNHHKEKQEGDFFNDAPDIKVIQEQLQSAKYQLGTLGGGNHFIEIQKGSDGHIWFMIHSGSRNFGYKTAKHYNDLAQRLCQRWYSDLPPFKGQDGLAFLPMEEKGGEYFKAMKFCLNFAYWNRDHMIKNVQKSIKNHISVTFENEINIHHNYATMENHFGSNVMVHRKGATSAVEGQLGLIPGSQGTSSYVVEGKGNPESFKSCSHGAGRKMGRKQAQRTLSLENEIKSLNDRGILHSIRNEKDLDEAPGSYKDIDVVMEEQKDLVDIKVKLEPLAVIKG